MCALEGRLEELDSLIETNASLHEVISKLESAKPSLPVEEVVSGGKAEVEQLKHAFVKLFGGSDVGSGNGAGSGHGNGNGYERGSGGGRVEAAGDNSTSDDIGGDHDGRNGSLRDGVRCSDRNGGNLVGHNGDGEGDDGDDGDDDGDGSGTGQKSQSPLLALSSPVLRIHDDSEPDSPMRVSSAATSLSDPLEADIEALDQAIADEQQRLAMMQTIASITSDDAHGLNDLIEETRLQQMSAQDLVDLEVELSKSLNTVKCYQGAMCMEELLTAQEVVSDQLRELTEEAVLCSSSLLPEAQPKP